MFARDVHVSFAILTVLMLVAATAEGAIRAVVGRPAGVAAGRTRVGVLLLVALTASAGLALLVGGHRPHEWLHIIYAVLALGLVPIADNAATMLRSNRSKALTRLGGGLVSLVVIARLFATG